MFDFPVKINNITFMSSEIVPYIRKCKSDEAVEYIIQKTSCTLNEADEIVSDIKNMMYNNGYSMYAKKNADTFTVCPNCGKKYSFLKVDCDECGYSTRKSTNVTEKAITENIDINTPKCPQCGSTAVFAGARTYSGTSYSTVNRCANCGHRWKPRRKKHSWF